MKLDPMKDSYSILIIGGGTAGLTVASQLLLHDPTLDLAIVEPSEKHYYQPLWTMVGAGIVEREVTERLEADYMPAGADWIKDRVASLEPDSNKVTLESGATVGYDYLVVCPGIQIDYDKVDGLPETLGKNGVCCNYSYDLAPYTWETLSGLNRGRAIFTQPPTPIKCGGAPQKIMYLTADHLRRKGALGNTEVHFMSPGEVVFGVKEFEKTLKKVIARYGIDFHFKHELIAVRGPEQQAIFRITEPDGKVWDKTIEFDMIHVVPPQSAPDFIKKSALANAEGWVDLNKDTLQHNRYPNVFGLGDAGSTPNAKTGAAVRKQAPTVSHNLASLIKNGKLTHPKIYDGYSSCPLVTGYGKLVLAEFDYNNRPLPSFSFDTTQERYSMYALKLYVLPDLYWNGMLRGRA